MTEEGRKSLFVRDGMAACPALSQYIIGVRGTYSITKQKFLNQGKIAALKVMKYDNKYDELMQLYLDAFQKHFDAFLQIQRIIESFNNMHNLPFEDTA